MTIALQLFAVLEELDVLVLPDEAHHHHLILLLVLLYLLIVDLIGFALPLSVVDQVRVEFQELIHFRVYLLHDNILQLRHVGFFDHGDGHVDQEGEQKIIQIVGAERVHVGSDVRDDLQGQARQRILVDGQGDLLHDYLDQLHEYDEHPDVGGVRGRVREVDEEKLQADVEVGAEQEFATVPLSRL